MRGRQGALSAVLTVVLLWPRPSPSCPAPCACFVPSEVHCTFRSLPAVPAGLPAHAQRLNLGFNSIQSLSVASFSGLTKLELLLIHGNEIPDIPDGALKDLSSLQVLKLSYNKLRAVTGRTLRGLSVLRRLHLDHNRIESVHPGAFRGLAALRLLHLEGNRLRQLHPGTFATVPLLGHLGPSTLRHLNLAGNRLAALPPAMMATLPLLDSLHLHGNPWACDCRLHGLLRWARPRTGVLKCRKDKAYEGGQLCATCASPRLLRTREIQQLTHVTCARPSIRSPLRPNRTGVPADEDGDEDGEADDHQVALEGLLSSPGWTVTLNMTDEHGNAAELACTIKKSINIRQLQLNQTDAAGTDVDATVGLDLGCPVTRRTYERLWKLIAYYSEEPVTLVREPGDGHRYRQEAAEDALYYTGVRVQMAAEPAWLLQPSVRIQLDRRLSTAGQVLLSFGTRFVLPASGEAAGDAGAGGWVMVDADGAGPRALAAVEGSSCVLSCPVHASERPSISWILPDGSVLEAPTTDPTGRLSVLSSGRLTVRSLRPSDSGRYVCVARVAGDADHAEYRVSVQSTNVAHTDSPAATVRTDAGQPLLLPCVASAVPEATVTWILPDATAVGATANRSDAFVTPDGSLSLPRTHAGDGGLYRCVAVNQRGTDRLTVRVAVTNKRPRRPGPKPASESTRDIVQDEGGSGEGDEDQASPRAPAGDDKAKTGRRKLRVWKEPEAKMAEGRRFESRRRIQVANKQINPERWADILARVRGRNVRKGTEIPATAPSPAGPQMSPTAASPVRSPPSEPPRQTATGPEDESSADPAPFGDDDRVSGPVSSTLDPLDAVNGEGAAGLRPRTSDADVPGVTTGQQEPPLEAGSLAEAETDGHFHLEVNSEASEVETLARVQPTSAMLVSGSGLPDVPSGHLARNELSGQQTPPMTQKGTRKKSHFRPTSAMLVPSPSSPWGQTGSSHLEKSSLSAQPTPLTGKGMKRKSQSDYTTSGPAWSRSQDGFSIAAPRPTSLAQRVPNTVAVPGDEDATPTARVTWSPKTPSPSPGVPHASRRRAKGKRRFRPHKAVDRQRQTPKMASPPPPTPTMPPARAPRVDTTVSTPRSQKPTRLGPQEKPRRRHGKKPGKHQDGASTMRSVTSVSPPSPSRGHGHRHLVPPTPTDGGTIGGPSGATGLGYYVTVNPKTLQESRPATDRPVPDAQGRNQHGVTHGRDYGTDAPVTSTSSVSTVGKSGVKPSPLVTRGTPRWTPSRTARPGEGQTDAPVGAFGADPTDSPHPKELEDVGFPSDFLSDPKVSSPFRREEMGHPATVPKIRMALTSTQGGTTAIGGQNDAQVTHSVSESGPQNPSPSPVWTDHWMSPVSPIERTTKPAIVTPTSHPPPPGSTEGVSFNFVGNPETEGPPVTRDLTQPQWQPRDPSMSSSHQDGVNQPQWRPSDPSTPSSHQDGVNQPQWRPSDPSTPSSHQDGVNQPQWRPRDPSMSSSHQDGVNQPQWRPSDPSTPSSHQDGVNQPQWRPSDPSTPSSHQDGVNQPQWRPSDPSTPSSHQDGVNQPQWRPSDPSTPSSHQDGVNQPQWRPSDLSTPSSHQDGVNQPQWRPSDLSTPSSHQDGVNLSSEEELGEGPLRGVTPNPRPRGPDSHRRGDGTHLPHPGGRDPVTTPFPKGTVQPLHMAATGTSSGHSGTFQPPRRTTDKPQILPNGQRLTTPKSPTATPAPWRKPGPLNKVTDPKRDPRPNGYAEETGRNVFPEPRNPMQGFPQPGVTPKSPMSTSLTPLTGRRKVDPGPYNRVHSQSSIFRALGPPAPPLFPAPRTVEPPSPRPPTSPVAGPTRSSVPFPVSPVQPSRSFQQTSLKVVGGGPPASKFWTLGEKPQIISKTPQTVSVKAEADVVFPCEATGKPRPFVTWTKVSTGALMTPNTRIQRFEVLKNGSLVIHNVQVQDRGQYLCTASNLHGADKTVVLLSVTVQQPQISASPYQDVTIFLGETIAMECLAKGSPDPQISWIFPDRTVWHTVSPAASRVTLHENRTLSIKDATFSDRGVYRCVASNAAGADSLSIRLHVAALPPVIQQDQAEDISLPPGLSIHVHCSAKAAPPASVRWVLRDGTQLRPSQFLHGHLFVFPNGTLFIRNLTPKDSGRYDCVVSNPVGSARRTVQLTVRRPAAANAHITGSSPPRTDVGYGGTLRLDCSAAGDPWPRILWRLPSKRMMDSPLSSDGRIKAFANGTLLVESVTDKDGGDYLCVARNGVGDDRVALRVNVVMKPAKIEHKDDRHDRRVFYGGDLKVDCVATGLPDPEISWSLPDGRLVNSLVHPGEDDGGRYMVFHNGTLYFHEVGMRQQGDYTCVAQNQLGKDEMTVRVTVVSGPAAIADESYLALRVPYGDTVTVACAARGEPVPKVTWLSPANRVIPSASEKYHVDGEGTLVIRKVQRSDDGNYTCLVRNSGGEDRKTVWVQVTVRPPTINGHPDAVTTVREVAAGGTRKVIDCLAEGVPTPRVLWSLPEGVTLPAPYYGNGVTVHQNGSLDIKTLRKAESVQLVCIGRNEGGEAKLIVQLTVLDPGGRPRFRDPAAEAITATAGHTINLNCSATGTPRPTLSWVLPDGTELRGGQRLGRFYHRADGVLLVSGLSPADAGPYRCLASNPAGHAERLVSLKVGPEPDPSGHHRNLVSITHGETLRLPCPASGTWTLPGGLSLDGPQAWGRFSVSDDGTLTVRGVSVFDRGTYLCRGDAGHGPSVVSFPVVVIAYPPRITTEPTPVIYARPGHTVTMTCMAVGIPKAEVTWDTPDGSRLTVGTQARLYGNRMVHPQGSLTIQSATARDAGFYKCVAKNLLGTDSKATYVHVY